MIAKNTDHKIKRDFRGEKSYYFTHHTHAGYLVRGEIWLEKNGTVFMDSKRLTLLRLIDKHGSLAAAARTMKLGYNTAWLWVMAMNHLSSSPLVERGSGGVNGGYSKLTRQGHRVIENYNKLNGSLKEAIGESENLQLIS